MRFYVTADVHGFYSPFREALEAAGYFSDTEAHQLVILGDLFDRGKEAPQMQDFVLQQMEEGGILLIKGNHEDLFEDLVTVDRGIAYEHHLHNGTYDTALQLTGRSILLAETGNWELAWEARRTPFYREIIPAMRDYYETERYIFAHGWLPGIDENGLWRYRADWRDADGEEWRRARWINGMDAARTFPEEKTVLCGHWHASYGHAKYEKKGREFGPEADFSPYYGPKVIALDACTAVSGRVNVLVLEDGVLSGEANA